MKKNFKLVLALVLSVMMILGSIAAIAATGDLAKDTQIKISGLQNGDTVYLYKVLQWEEDAGWRKTTKFSSLDNADINTLTTPYTSNTRPSAITLTREDAEAITKVAQGQTADYIEPVTGDTMTKAVEPGMYLALIVPGDKTIVYNPIIVSADYYDDPNTSEIDASTAMLGSSTVAKKEKVTLTKETSDITLNIGDYVQFTVKTTIPAYADTQYDPSFIMADQLSTGLKFAVDSTHLFEVKKTSDSSAITEFSGTPANGDSNFTLTFNTAYIKSLTAATPITVTYWAQITGDAPFNVNEETNDVDVKFSNNPYDSSKHGHLKDEVKEYTFTIDGNLLGISEYRTGELVKVGKDAQGNDILESKELSNKTVHSALAGATFGLYRTKADAEAASDENNPGTLYTNGTFNGTVVTDDKGLMKINGLKAGTYWLKELDAPDGFMRDQNVHEIYITYTTETVTVSGEAVGDGCTYPDYDVEVLKTYTVMVDSTTGGASSSYSMTLSGPIITSTSPSDSSNEIVNIKGVELPSTGGIGTTIFYVGGSLLVLAAAILLITKRRMSSND